jgi:tRNA-specific 2-thiouridylase
MRKSRIHRIFVPNGDYTAVVKKMAPQAEKAGDIVHLDGRILGRHDGIIHYTIGQRKGLGIGGGHNDGNDPFYVVKIDPSSNTVIVGPKEALKRDIVFLRDCNWLTLPAPAKAHPPLAIEVKLRSMTRAVDGFLTRYADGRAEITLKDPQYGISAGQAAVCYRGTHVLGGGWIAGSAQSEETLAA